MKKLVCISIVTISIVFLGGCTVLPIDADANEYIYEYTDQIESVVEHIGASEYAYENASEYVYEYVHEESFMAMMMDWSSNPDLTRFYEIELYTTGSNQEWALWALSQLDNSDEKIRLYDFLMRSHSYLMRYDLHDYIDEYNSVKYRWTDAMSDFDEESQHRIQLMLDDEQWSVDIIYPLYEPFSLTHDEFSLVYFYFTDANPQFIFNVIVPGTWQDGAGLVPIITVPSYYAFADRRQEAYSDVLAMFYEFEQHVHQNVNMEDDYEVIRYVYGYIVNALGYDWDIGEFVPLEQTVRLETIRGFFGETRLTQCKGYTMAIMYILNRFGIPAIDQGGSMIVRDEHGEIIDNVPHAWNLVMLEGEWYFMDATWEIPGEDFEWFLMGRGENNDSYFLWWHGIAYDMLYPEAAINDFVRR